MSTFANDHVFGPVPSRRLGRSLGVDLVPYKTCTFDCIYCQLGRTTNLTLRREEYVPVPVILAELERKLAGALTADYITLSGSGEPTLHARFGEIIDGIKRLTRIPVAVLTNGSLLPLPEVRDALGKADLVVPSLDAGDPELFRCVNRPHAGIEFEAMLDGLRRFTRTYSGRVWLEIFLLDGITGTTVEAGKIARLIEGLRIERIQLNTVDRPACESVAKPVNGTKMKELARLFSAPTEVIEASRREGAGTGDARAAQEAVRALLARRPCTVEGLAAGLNLHRNEIVKTMAHLISEGVVMLIRQGSESYYAAKRKEQ